MLYNYFLFLYHPLYALRALFTHWYQCAMTYLRTPCIKGWGSIRHVRDDMERRLLYNNYTVSETRGNYFKFIPWHECNSIDRYWIYILQGKVLLSRVRRRSNMTNSIHHLFSIILPQLACLALLALHQTHHPLISTWTFLSIALRSFLTETISTHYCSNLRFAKKNCQQAIASLSLCVTSFALLFFLPILARCSATPTKQPSHPPGL